ncbi:hypothetical protein A6R72_16405 [Xanthomonas translucens pv. graminis]|nr:hypothetical protein A6R72_16405 [Xanthomonas translucens pv. graminis]
MLQRKFLLLQLLACEGAECGQYIVEHLALEARMSTGLSACMHVQPMAVVGAVRIDADGGIGAGTG